MWSPSFSTVIVTVPVLFFIVAYGLVAPFPLVVVVALTFAGVVAAVAAYWLAEPWTSRQGDPSRVVLVVLPVALLLAAYLLPANVLVFRFNVLRVSLTVLAAPVPLVLGASPRRFRHGGGVPAEVEAGWGRPRVGQAGVSWERGGKYA